MKYLVPLVLIVLALLGANSIYAVGQGHAAAVTGFGRVDAIGIEPGLHIKWPFVQQVKVYDTRVIEWRSEPEDYKTVAGDSIRAGVFVRWRIVDPRTWLDAVGGDELQVAQQIEPLVRSALRVQIGKHDLAELLASDGGTIDASLRDAVSGDARSKLGIDIVDVGVERVLPPDDALSGVYKRMAAEAASTAAQVRDTGTADAAAIRAKGDAADQQVLAAAAQKAAAVRGEGDAEAAKIYAQASAKDPQFFRYWSSLETWRKTFAGGGAVVVLDKDSPFMQAIDEGAAAVPAKH